MNPVDPASALGQPGAAELERRFGPGEARPRDEGWRELAWKQTWFGCEVEASYTFDPADRLVRIDLAARDARDVEAAMRRALGEPERDGPSPQVMMSARFIRWARAGVAYFLEDYAPGCEVGIVRDL